MTLREVLEDLDRYSVSSTLFLPQDEGWTLDTPAIVTDIDEIDDPDGGALSVEGRMFDYALGIDAVSAIVKNVRAQDVDADATALLEAFLFYYDHDAFIELRRH